MLQNGLRSYLFAGDETTHDTLRVKLARRACEASGLILKESVWKRMKSNPSKFFHKKEIFSEKSIEEVRSTLMFNKIQIFSPLTNQIAMLAKRITVLPFVDTMRVEGNFQKVEEFYLTELKNRIDSLGPQHPQVAITCVHLAELYSYAATICNHMLQHSKIVFLFFFFFPSCTVSSEAGWRRQKKCSSKLRASYEHLWEKTT